MIHTSLAGSFFHLWLAQRAYPEIFPEWVAEGETWAAFLAGSVAPDLGFFPGGPRVFSERIHHGQTGDFLRALRDEVQDEVERAFVAGWALHLYTDTALHPWVNSRVDTLLQDLSGRFSQRRDLWHMRLENGIDCDLLGRNELRFLWDVDIHFPQRSGGSGILPLAGQIFYGEDAREDQLRQGMESQKKWLRRLPRIFLWTGNVCPASPKGVIPAVGFCVRPLVRKILGDWLGSAQRWDTMAAVARPLHLESVTLSEAEKLGSQALCAFKAGFAERFDSLENLDLDTGQLASCRECGDE